MDTGRGSFAQFETKEAADEHANQVENLRQRVAERDGPRESDESEDLRPSVFEIGERVRIKNSIFEVEKVTEKRLVLHLRVRDSRILSELGEVVETDA